MKIISYLAFIFLMVRFNAEEQKPSTPDIQQYCNTRFNYCLSYDSNIFNKFPPDKSQRGMTVADKTGKIFLECYASNNPYKRSVEYLMKANMEYLLRNEPSGLKRVIHQSKDENSYILNFETGDTYFKQELVMANKQFVVYTLRIPSKEKAVIEAALKTTRFVPNTLMASS